MLQDLPKKDKNYAHPTRAQLILRTIGECLRRSVVPLLMYLFMSMAAFSTQLFSSEKVTWWSMLLGIVCIIIGALYNAYLCFNYGKKHYDVFVTGELHRLNDKFGIQTGGDYRAHCEYRPWKGFVIGLFTGSLALLFGIISIFTYKVDLPFLLLAGWAFLPVLWARQLTGNLYIKGVWSLFMLILPIVVSGVFYLLGAHKRKLEKERADARKREVERLLAEQKQKQEERKMRVQTEEQRRKTAQSKKKK